MEEMTLEKAMERLEQITKQLEKNEDSLEKSIELFQEGLELSKFCSQRLNHFEKQIIEIVGDKKEDN